MKLIPSWLSTWKQLCEHRRDVALQEKHRIEVEADSLQQRSQHLKNQIESMTTNQSYQGTNQLDLENWREHSEYRGYLRATLIETTIKQSVSEEKLSRQRRVVQQHETKTSQLELLVERSAARLANATSQSERRQFLENLAAISDG